MENKCRKAREQEGNWVQLRGRKEHSEMLLHEKVGKICLYAVDTANEYHENFRAQNLEINNAVSLFLLLPVLSGVSNTSFP